MPRVVEPEASRVWAATLVIVVLRLGGAVQLGLIAELAASLALETVEATMDQAPSLRLPQSQLHLLRGHHPLLLLRLYLRPSA